MSETFLVGAAEVDITPSVGLAMDGYVAREGVSVGVHDRLMAQIIVIQHGETRVAIVTLDVLAVSADFTDSLRQSLAQVLNADMNAIWICPSHTHCGPRGLQNWFPIGDTPTLNDALIRHVTDRILDTSYAVRDSLVPARMFSVSGELNGVGGDRNQQSSQVDSRLTAFRFEALTGETIAVLFHYPCHPTVLSANTLEYSADWPGAARKHIQAHYPDATVAFMNGAIGNISTRYFRRESTFAEAERLGGLVGERAIELLAGADENPPLLDADSLDMKLPVRDFPLGRKLESTGDARRDATRGEGAALESELAEAFKGRDSIIAQIYALKLGDWTLFGIPGEAFSELAVAVREYDPNALIVGLVNDYVGYFPTQAVIDAATYEALSSPYDVRAHKTIFQTLMALLGNI